MRLQVEIIIINIQQQQLQQQQKQQQQQQQNQMNFAYNSCHYASKNSFGEYLYFPLKKFTCISIAIAVPICICNWNRIHTESINE